MNNNKTDYWILEDAKIRYLKDIKKIPMPKELKIELIRNWIIKKIDNGELSEEYYHWQQLDYGTKQYELAQEIADKFVHLEKLAFEVECGNNLSEVFDDEQLDIYYEAFIKRE